MNVSTDSNSIGGPARRILIVTAILSTTSSLKADLFTALNCWKQTFHCGDMVVNINGVAVVNVVENEVCFVVAVWLCCYDPYLGIFEFWEGTGTCSKWYTCTGCAVQALQAMGSCTVQVLVHYVCTVQQEALPSGSGKCAYLYSRTRDFNHSFCCILVTYSTRTVWYVFQRLYYVADKDMSSKTALLNLDAQTAFL